LGNNPELGYDNCHDAAHVRPPPQIANYKFFLWEGRRHHYIVLVDNASESTYTVISQLVLAFVNVKNIIFKKIL